MAKLIIIYDSKCLVCSKFIQTIYINDREKLFYYTDFQSDFYRKLLEKKPGLKLEDSIVFLYNDTIFLKSEAILRLMSCLPGYYKLMKLLLLIPGFIRDYCYSFIAKKRIWLFGSSNYCLVLDRKRILS